MTYIGAYTFMLFHVLYFKWYHVGHPNICSFVYLFLLNKFLEVEFIVGPN